ncbi:MAG: TonB-dependent receptor [Bacteroides sp.]|nr:TonB-dependent receptor [Bacteroides sp.]MCM1379163.1 TonB-dependent receptor [Bacteroides sp.]MCM1445188.1 TonB-dependent receptor [Prevotella sp.]
MNKPIMLALCLVGICQASAGAKNAQDSLSVELSTVEVTANRANEKTPVAFTNVSKQQLLKANDGRDITYLLGMTPSVVATSDAGMGMGYTAMRVRGTDQTRINITANGIPLNDGESGIVFWVNMPDFASSVRDVQIQRGAGTSTNGAGAFGASVNMITDAPSDEAYAEVSGSYGTYNTNRETFRVGSGLLGGHWSFDARLSHMSSDGYIERASSKLWSYFGQAAYTADNTLLRFLAFGGKERTYMAWDYASKEEMKEYGRRYNPCGQYDPNDPSKGYYPDQYDYFTQHHFQLHLNQRLGQKWNLTAALHYTDDYGNYEQYKANRSLEEYGLQPYYLADGTKVKKQDLVRLKYNDNGFGGGLVNVRYNNERWDVILGGAVNYFHGKHFGKVSWVRNYIGELNPLQEYYNNVGKKLDGNIFARANFEILKGFSAFADLQYRGIHYTIDGHTDTWDWINEEMERIAVDRTWHFFNPKVGLNYTKGAHRAFASWSVAHKEPTRSNFTDGFMVAGKYQDPKAERLFDYELGYSFNHRIISAGVNLYYMDYKDQLVTTGQLSDTGNPLSVNVPESYRMGVELQASFRPWCDWFEWNFGITLSRNRIKNFTEYINDDDWVEDPITINYKDTPIAFSPDVTFTNSFNFTVKGFEAQIQSQYVGKQYMSNVANEETSLDPYFITNLHLNYTLPRIKGVKKINVGFSIYNLFNSKYCNNGYSGAGYYMDGGKPIIYRYAGYAAQAPTHVAATLLFRF